MGRTDPAGERDEWLVPLADAARMREIDRAAIEERGLGDGVLMEAAGRAVWEECEAAFAPTCVVVACGGGNNGGDGFVVARRAAEAGRDVRLLLAAEPGRLRGDAATMFARLPARLRPAAPARAAELAAALEGADVVIDAVLGTGTRGPARGESADWIAALNARPAHVPLVAIDLPSGLDADGAAAGELGPVVRADMTVTIGAAKVGLAMQPGAECAGRVVVAPICFPSDLLATAAGSPPLHLLTERHVAGLLPPRPAVGHKGTFGRAVVVAGSVGLAGAAVLATRAALRSGAGYVEVMAPAALYDLLVGAAPEAIVRPVASASGRSLDGASGAELLEAAGRAGALALGPGLGRDAATLELVRTVVAGAGVPTVVDADALAALSDGGRPGARPGAPLLLTPHPGEMAALLGTTTAAVGGDRIGAAREAARRFGAVVVLKGARSVIARPDGAARLNPTGNTGLAKGGSGDVLTGLLVGLLAQGMSPATAADLGVFLHGLAADLLLAREHPRSLTPGDVVGGLGAAFRALDRAARGEGDA